MEENILTTTRSEALSRVLLLNSTYEVLGTVSIARAIRMTMRTNNSVRVLEEVSGRFWHTAGGLKIPVPSVVILKNYVNIRKKRQDSGNRRFKIYARDKYQCQYCSTKLGRRSHDLGRLLELSDLTLDHILPRSRGGQSFPSNLVTCCVPCNQRKANRTPEEARMPLRMDIHEAVQIGLDKSLICTYLEHRQEWVPYIEIQEEFKPFLQKSLAAQAPIAKDRIVC